jgi:hypothetical protein
MSHHFSPEKLRLFDESGFGLDVPAVEGEFCIPFA